MSSILGDYANTATLGIRTSENIARQHELWPQSEFMIAVHEAVNGSVVRIAKGPGHLSRLWIVPKGDDVVAVIAAAIVDLKLEVVK